MKQETLPPLRIKAFKVPSYLSEIYLIKVENVSGINYETPPDVQPATSFYLKESSRSQTLRKIAKSLLSIHPDTYNKVLLWVYSILCYTKLFLVVSMVKFFNYDIQTIGDPFYYYQ